jgi:hypothetical protein
MSSNNSCIPAFHLDPFLGPVCTLCKCALAASPDQKMHKKIFDHHIQSKQHHASVMLANNGFTYEDKIVKNESFTELYQQQLLQYNIDVHDLARCVVRNMNTNNKSFLEEYLKMEEAKVKKCTVCSKSFQVDQHVDRNISRRHFPSCNSKEKKYVIATGYYCKSSRKMFIEIFNALTIHDMVINNMFCQDLLEQYHQLCYLDMHKHNQNALIINPDAIITCTGLNTLKLIEDVTQHIFKHFKIIEDWADNEKNPNVSGYDYIQGGRLEIYLDDRCIVPKKQLWIKILKDYIQTNNLDITHVVITKEVKWYCEQQAKKDERLNILHKYISDSNKILEMRFSNYAMIITNNKSKEQMLHMDAIIPNYQFILACTDQCPSTKFAPVTDDDAHITSISELVEKTNIIEGIHKDLLHILKYDKTVHQFMFNYGNLFSNVTVAESQLVQVGSVTSLPGSVVHAGPACTVPRAILFYTCGVKKVTRNNKRKADISENMNDADTSGLLQPMLYNKKVQFNAVTLLLEIIITIWQNIKETEHKMFLLSKLHSLMLQKIFNYNSHSPGGYCDVVNVFLEEASNPKLSKRDWKKICDGMIEATQLSNE